MTGMWFVNGSVREPKGELIECQWVRWIKGAREGRQHPELERRERLAFAGAALPSPSLGAEILPPEAAVLNLFLRFGADRFGRCGGLGLQGGASQRIRELGRALLAELTVRGISKNVFPSWVALEEGLLDLLPQSFAGEPERLESLRPDAGDHLADFQGHGLGDLLGGLGLTLEGVPDLNQKFAGQCGDDEGDFTLACQQLTTPARVGVVGRTQQRVPGLDEERAQVLAAMPLDAAPPSARAAVVKGGGKAGVLDQSFGRSEAVDVADQGAEGEGQDVADAAEAGEFEEFWILEDLLGQQAGPARLNEEVMLESEQRYFQDLALGGIPGSGRENSLAALLGSEAEEGLLQTDAVIAEIRGEGVAGGGDILDGLPMGEEPVAAVLGQRIRDPDGLGIPAEVSPSNAGGADAIVVGVGFLELAKEGALQDQSVAINGSEPADYFKGVAGGLEDEGVGGEGVAFRPGTELGDGDFVEGLKHDSGHGRTPLDQGGREGIGMDVETDDPGRGIRGLLHWLRYVSEQEDGDGSGDYMHSGMRGGPQCRCFSPMLIHENGVISSKRHSRATPEVPPVCLATTDRP